MKIVVSEIPEEGLEIHDEHVSWQDADGSRTLATLDARVQKIETEVLITGSVTAQMHYVCSRCLKEFDAALEVPIELVYRPAAEIDAEDTELQPAELDTGFYTDDVIDMDEVSAEQVLLNVPMKPLCSEDCKGICPECGANRNEKDCGCGRKLTDPRLAALERLKKGKEQ